MRTHPRIHLFHPKSRPDSICSSGAGDAKPCSGGGGGDPSPLLGPIAPCGMMPGMRRCFVHRWLCGAQGCWGPRIVRVTSVPRGATGTQVSEMLQFLWGRIAPSSQAWVGERCSKSPKYPKKHRWMEHPPSYADAICSLALCSPPRPPKISHPPTPSPNPQIPRRLRVTPLLSPSLAIPCSRGGMEAPGWGGGGSEAGALGAAAAVVAGAAAGGAARAAGGAASPAAAAAGAVGVIAAAAAAAVRVGAQRAGGRGAGAVVGDGTLASAAEGKGKLSHGPGVG